MLRRLRAIGPGAMVAPAFIGPGAVTTASVAGARFGPVLLWAIAFSIVATIVLQEMSGENGGASRTNPQRPTSRVPSPTPLMPAILPEPLVALAALSITPYLVPQNPEFGRT